MLKQRQVSKPQHLTVCLVSRLQASSSQLQLAAEQLLALRG